MAKPSQGDIDQMIQYARPTNRDLVRRDINQAINSSISSLVLKVAPYVYNNGTSKELLCLHGTVACQYRGNRYNIPIEIWLQQDHPNVPPLAYVKPTPDMYVAPTSKDVQPDGTVIITYLRNWRHPQSDLITLLNAMSEAFSQSPPVYASSSSTPRPTTYTSSNPTSYPTPYPSNLTSYPSNPTSYPSNPTPYSSNPIPYSMNPTPYSTNPTSYPNNNPTPYATPYPTNPSMPMPGVGNPSYSYSHGYGQPAVSEDIIYRDSIRSAVLDKVRYRLDEAVQLGNAEMDSMRKAQQDLTTGERKLQSLISEAQQQQAQAQNYIENLRTKTNEIVEAGQKMPAPGKENSIKDDALTLPAPVYKQLLEAYAEEHAIQDLLYYLADGLKKESIRLDTYLKHVRELSRKQFMLRATMQKCRRIAGLPIK